MVILDTDHMTFLERQESPDLERLAARLAQLPPEEITTTIVTYEEQSRGWLAFIAQARTLAQQINAYRKLSRHLDTYRRTTVLEFDERAAVHYQRLRHARIRTGPMDLRIAAIALVHDATVLTRNLADFRRVPGLKVEDWTV
jgi:tRNA(fMet)-specific endonuclease VapC